MVLYPPVFNLTCVKLRMEWQKTGHPLMRLENGPLPEKERSKKKKILLKKTLEWVPRRECLFIPLDNDELIHTYVLMNMRTNELMLSSIRIIPPISSFHHHHQDVKVKPDHSP
ncbi:hypothetical protein CDAR_573911 [Caerostris darwini]|uniref:Uncharacterized protein n=1 Tax=Caerostris darwini TaxID=1538125 RepID=A0AAV4TB66_9ARAC|nr:hypothetical protein CDAR_573911 [Caerostris darwini]